MLNLPSSPFDRAAPTPRRAANDNQPPRKTTAATPLGLRLARGGRKDDLRRYIRYGTVTVVPTWLSAESGLPEAGQAEADRVTETRPSPDEMVTLAAKDAIAARVGIGPIAAGELDAPMRARLRLDKCGHIMEWRGSDNRWHDAAELFRQPKGKRRKTDEERQADNERHLAIRGSGGFPEPSRYIERGSGGEDYRRQRAARWAQTLCACNDNARVWIDRAGVGGRHSFENAWANAGLPPASRIPRYMVAIAPGAEFLGYRQHGNPRAMQGGVEGGHDLVERQIIETIDAPRVDAALGERAKVLDMSIAGMTAREIAAEMGWGNTKQSERWAVKAQDDALQALANLEEKIAA